MTDEPYRPKGRFQKGHPFIGNQSTKQPDPDETNTDFDAAILDAAQNFGRPGGKAKVGLPGYCASLRDTRPQDFALLVTKALQRKSLASSAAAAATPLTVEFVPCPPGYFLPGEEARALWAARTGSGPQLVIDNAIPEEDDDASDTDTATDDNLD